MRRYFKRPYSNLMKNKFLSFFIVLALLSLKGNAQSSKPETLTKSQIFLNVNNKNSGLSLLDDKSIPKLLGSPAKISTKKWETAGTDKVKTYYYTGYTIATDNGSLNSIDIAKKAASLVFLINKKYSQPFTAGSSANLIKASFPKAWAAKDKNGVFVNLTDTEAFVRFTISGNVIKTIEYSVDES